MSTIAIIVILVVIVLVVLAALGAFFILRRQRQQSARQEFGPEYERTVQERGSARQAERELRERRGRLEREVQPLSDESNQRYRQRWDEEVERTFVDNPTASLEAADRVVTEILHERNFPTDSRGEAAKGVGVMHPDVVEDFREAQSIRAEAIGPQEGGDSEKMRQAIQKYRSVYERLIER